MLQSRRHCLSADDDWRLTEHPLLPYAVPFVSLNLAYGRGAPAATFRESSRGFFLLSLGASTSGMPISDIRRTEYAVIGPCRSQLELRSYRRVRHLRPNSSGSSRTVTDGEPNSPLASRRCKQASRKSRDRGCFVQPERSAEPRNHTE